ncbi:MAG: HAD family hydrolase [Oscillospiraceae bacterium]|nr:HAD family hydrolase [Oscillospiraceae bacterium]
MIVSFDLDETLFVNPAAVSIEEAPPFPRSVLYPDRLRKGAPEFLRWMHESGIQVWIYTTSNRSERYIRHYFRFYGVQIDQVVNAARHEKEVQRNRKDPLPSKYPAYYHIDLHVDDEMNVYQNGVSHGFRVFLLHDEDPQWTSKLRQEIERIRRIKEQQ